MAKILLVDDSPPQRELIAAGLRACGHAVLDAPTAHEAMRMLAGDRIDGVITDIFMPDCDGLELIRMIRQNHRTLPIVAMTAGFGGDSDLFLRIALKLGANMGIRKGDFSEDLPGALDAVLSALTPSDDGDEGHTFD